MFRIVERLENIMGKKILCILLTILLVMTLRTTINAGSLTKDGDSVSVPVKYTVDNTEFIITIPAEITVGNVETSFEITAEKMNLRPDEEVIVKIVDGCDANGEVTLVRQQEDMENAPVLTTKFTQNTKSIAENDYVVGKFVDSADGKVNVLGAVSMSPPVVDENTKAGDYIGTIQFEVELRKA